MSAGTPRCVYCSKPTRSHEVTIAPAAYATAYDDRSFDADQGSYHAAVCHGCWAARDESALQELADAPTGEDESNEDTNDDADGPVGLSAAARAAIREMNHEHVRFELTD